MILDSDIENLFRLKKELDLRWIDFQNNKTFGEFLTVIEATEVLLNTMKEVANEIYP